MTSTQEKDTDQSTAYYEDFAQHFAEEVAWIHSDLDAVVDADPVGIILFPSVPIIMDIQYFIWCSLIFLTGSLER